MQSTLIKITVTSDGAVCLDIQIDSLPHGEVLTLHEGYTDGGFPIRFSTTPDTARLLCVRDEATQWETIFSEVKPEVGAATGFASSFSS